MTDLVAYGLGSTLGAGLFVVAGQAAAGSGSRPAAGPAVSLSFLFAAVACLFSALCYAEFASRIPVAGSAYSFAYASLGEGVAWFIGWNLTLEYGVSAPAVARAWEQYVVEFFRLIGCPLPTVLYACPLFPFTRGFGKVLFKFTFFTISLFCVWQLIFLGDDHWPQFRIFAIEFNPFLHVWLSIGANSIRRAFRFAHAAIDALIRMNDQHILALVKAIYGADFDAVGVFARDAGIIDDICHLGSLVFNVSTA
jgi:amino acid transporter